MKHTKREKRLSLHGYWQMYVEPIMCYSSFRKQMKIMYSDKEFTEKFGHYNRLFKLSDNQIKILNEEFGV